MKRLFMVILLLAVVGHGVEAKKPAREDSKVKNIIYMIGDGMGQNPVKLARVHAKLNMDAMPVKGELQTNNVFDKTPDSAAAATALAQ